MCKKFNLSAAIVFVDLSKAFDLALRQVVFGFCQGFAGSPRQELIELGLSETHADKLLLELMVEGTVLEQMQVPQALIEIAKSIHTGSWFQFSDLDEVIFLAVVVVRAVSLELSFLICCMPAPARNCDLISIPMASF